MNIVAEPPDNVSLRSESAAFYLILELAGSLRWHVAHLAAGPAHTRYDQPLETIDSLLGLAREASSCLVASGLPDEVVLPSLRPVTLVECHLRYERQRVEHRPADASPDDASRIVAEAIAFATEQITELTAAASRLTADWTLRRARHLAYYVSQQAKQLPPAPADGTTRNAVALPLGGTKQQSDRPVWKRAERKLFFRGRVIRDYAKKRAPNQEHILDVLEASNWTAATLGSTWPSKRISETIRDFNAFVVEGSIRLASDGTGAGVVWRTQPNASSPTIS